MVVPAVKIAALILGEMWRENPDPRKVNMAKMLIEVRAWKATWTRFNVEILAAGAFSWPKGCAVHQQVGLPRYVCLHPSFVSWMASQLGMLRMDRGSDGLMDEWWMGWKQLESGEREVTGTEGGSAQIPLPSPERCRRIGCSTSSTWDWCHGCNVQALCCDMDWGTTGSVLFGEFCEDVPSICLEDILAHPRKQSAPCFGESRVTFRFCLLFHLLRLFHFLHPHGAGAFAEVF